MSDRISDERIAELLDGKVPAAERAELLSQLAADADDFGVFAEAGGVLREAEEEEAALAASPAPAVAAPAVPPPADAPRVAPPLTGPAGPLDPPSARRPSRWGGRRARWLALVPVLALALLVPVLWSRRGGEGLGAPATALAKTRLPDRWLDEPPWSVTRGGDDNRDGLEPAARAARIGVYHTDLALAVATRDTQVTRLLANRIAYHLGHEAGLGTTGEEYVVIRDRAGAPPAELQPLLDEAGEEVMKYVVHADHVRLGAWAEAARIAARRRDAAFFTSSETRAAFRRAERIDELPEEARDAAGHLRQAAPGDWAAHLAAANTILRIIAS